ncbi:LIC_10190 family membrane protein [Spirosoma oryzicola]|uniref:LIC_10190 family membrane protein n=1 Tax=Spirosoma oryzicola TaxID=2898794 RepID=UPI001E2D4B22|nr:hypothetical protein [Spirosoma oryzicola]UHG93587.1 hypothetical protein LQ777_11930 [Spirosoma oryzicola]
MLVLLLLWLLLYFLFWVFGEGIIHLMPRRWAIRASPTETILTGLIGAVGLLQLASIFIPINLASVVGLVLLAAFINGRLLNQSIRNATIYLRTIGREPVWWLLVAVVLLYAIQRPTNPDSGAYHLPAIRYTERFATIPGLGNLFSRLAFNSSFFAIGAAVGCTDLVGQTLFPLNGFLLLVFGSYVIQQLWRADTTPALQVFQVGVLGLSLYFLIRQVNAPTPDVWATLLTLFFFLFWLNGRTQDNKFLTFLLLALVFTCLTVKLATLPLLLALPLLGYGCRRWVTWQNSVAAMALGGFLLIPWLVKNVILSGYLLFPLTEPDLFSVDWKVDPVLAQYEQQIITYWARFHVAETEFDPEKLTWPLGRWVSWWWTHWWFWYNWPNRPTFLLAFASPVFVLFLWMSARKRVQSWLTVYAVAFAGFVFWFIKAPEFRFGYAFIWTAALLPIGALVRHPIHPLVVRVPIIVLMTSLLGYFVVGEDTRKRDRMSSQLWKPQPLSHRYAGSIPYQRRWTRSKLAVLVPKAPCKSCFDIEQPCTPFFFNDLQLRGRTIADGFRRNPNPTDSLAINSNLSK